MANGRDGLFFLHKMSDEIDRPRQQPQRIGVDDAAGQHQAVEFFRLRLVELRIDRDLGTLVVMFEGLDVVLLVGNNLDMSAGTLERSYRLCGFDLLDAIRRQYRDVSSFQLFGRDFFLCPLSVPPIMNIRLRATPRSRSNVLDAPTFR